MKMIFFLGLYETEPLLIRWQLPEKNVFNKSLTKLLEKASEK